MNALLILLLILAVVLNIVVMGGILFWFVTHRANRRNFSQPRPSISKLLFIFGPLLLIAALATGLQT